MADHGGQGQGSEDGVAREALTQKLSASGVANLLRAGSDSAIRDLQHWQPPKVEELQAMLPQYEVTAFLARGGMGAVYKGVQRSLDRVVAIKILPPDIVDDGEANYTERFKQEARAMAKFKHPGIVTVYDAGEVELGRALGPPSAVSDARRLEDQPTHPKLLYFVMEFIEGTDVAQMVAANGKLPVDQALNITIRVCEALAYAHSRGVVHRDIKPSNVMIDSDGQVKVADFGLAKVVQQDSTSLTKSSVAMGTPDFVAPEALIPGMPVDQRADLYAVGVMLYDMLTGTVPRGRFEAVSQVVPKADRRLDAIVDKALQTDREKRYSTASELKRDVESVTQGSEEDGSADTPVRSSTSDGAAAKHAAHRSAHAPLIIGAAVILLGAGAFLLQKQDKTASTQPPSAPVPAWVTLTPIPAFLEGRAVKLWDAPGKIPSQSNYQWEDNALRIDGDSLRAEVNLTSVIFRAGVRMNRGDTDARLLLRLREKGSKSDHYALVVDNKRVQLIHSDSKTKREFGTWPLARPYQPDEWLQVEVRLIGDTIIVAADGAVMGIVRDAVALEPGRIALYGKSNAYFRDVSYIALDGVPEVELKTLVGSPVSGGVPSSFPPSAPKDTPFVNTLGMKFVPVPITGGPTDKQRVLFSVWETRVQDYEAFVQETKREWPKPPFEQGPTHPAVMVSWEDAKAFCAWLTDKERKAGKIGAADEYRLPSDHEWSCAVGIGDREDGSRPPHTKQEKVAGVYPWGADWPPPAGAGNHHDEAARKEEVEPNKPGLEGYNDGWAWTAPVGSFPPNVHGLHDLSGNAGEWCEDWVGETTPLRVVRGGVYDISDRKNLLSSYRMTGQPKGCNHTYGFRVVLTEKAVESGVVAPLPSASEARAAKLWDSPDKIPPNPKYKWEGDAVRDVSSIPLDDLSDAERRALITNPAKDLQSGGRPQ